MCITTVCNNILYDAEEEILAKEHNPQGGHTYRCPHLGIFTENQNNNNHTCDSHAVEIININSCEEKIVNTHKNEEIEHLFAAHSTSISDDDIKSKISNNSLLNNKKKLHLVTLLSKYKNVFDEKPGLVEDFEYNLFLKDETPFIAKPYPIPLKYHEKVEAEIEKMLKYNIIQRSNSKDISSTVIVAKKYGFIRLCLDRRKINENFEGRQSQYSLTI